jgi:hypothetical protein
VDYEPRGGTIADRLFVRRDLDRIFAYRRDAIAELLGDHREDTSLGRGLS